MTKAFYLILLLLISGCSMMSKEELDGHYKGTMTAVLKYSDLNIGMEDQIKTRECYAIFVTDTEEPKIVVTEIGTTPELWNIDISGISPQSNGVVFNIPTQTIKTKDYALTAIGNSIFVDSEGMKFDGMLDESKTLRMGFTGIAELNINGYTINPRVEIIYQMKKQ